MMVTTTASEATMSSV